MSKTINVEFKTPDIWNFTTSGGNTTDGTVTVDASDTKKIQYPLTASDGWHYCKARVRLLPSKEIFLVHTVGKHGSEKASDGSFTVTIPDTESDGFTENCLTMVVDNSNPESRVELSVELVVTNGTKTSTSPDPQIVLPPQNPKL